MVRTISYYEKLADDRAVVSTMRYCLRFRTDGSGVEWGLSKTGEGATPAKGNPNYYGGNIL